jgi:hypothetical protein
MVFMAPLQGLSMQQSAHSDAPLLQVAKALLDSAAKAQPKPQSLSMQGAALADPSTLTALLRFQEASTPNCQFPVSRTLSAVTEHHEVFALVSDCPTHIAAVYTEIMEIRRMLRGSRLALQDALTAQIGGAMAQAAKAAAPQGKKAAAAAATDAYEDNLDLAVALGWAFVDRVSYEVALLFLCCVRSLFACLRSQSLHRQDVNGASWHESATG